MRASKAAHLDALAGWEGVGWGASGGGAFGLGAEATEFGGSGTAWMDVWAARALSRRVLLGDESSQGRIGREDPTVAVAVDAGWGKDGGQPRAFRSSLAKISPSAKSRIVAESGDFPMISPISSARGRLARPERRRSGPR